MSAKRRIAIAEDHDIIREGLKMMLTRGDEFEVVGEAGDGHEAVRMASRLQPDLILMDLTMPRMNGLEAIREILRATPSTRILVLTGHASGDHIMAALQAGAHGYILKTTSRDELMAAIRTVLAGKSFLSPGISRTVIDGYLAGSGASGGSTPWDSLTQREREVLKLVAEGHTTREIAELFCLSAKTVDKHRSSMMRKLDLHNISAVTAYALEKGLVSH
jgi:DNA-binding NarL/FixJ family response regulator